MDHQLAIGLVVVMQPRLVLAQNKVGFEADDVVEEASELVDFAAHDDVGSRVLFQVVLVMRDLLLELLALPSQLLDLVAQLQHCEELFGVGQLLLFFYAIF